MICNLMAVDNNIELSDIVISPNLWIKINILELSKQDRMKILSELSTNNILVGCEDITTICQNTKNKLQQTIIANLI